MTRRIEYQQGEFIGTKGYKYIKDVPSNSNRRALFYFTIDEIDYKIECDISQVKKDKVKLPKHTPVYLNRTSGIFRTLNGEEVLVDFDIWNKYKHFRVSLSHGYPKISLQRRNYTLHSLIINAPKGFVIDHINRNKLDARRENLRVVSHTVNSYNQGNQSNNTSGYKGVCFDKSRNKYLASIIVEGKFINLGRFNTALEAYKEYLKASELYQPLKYENIS